jgi:hypothetical protein
LNDTPQDRIGAETSPTEHAHRMLSALWSWRHNATLGELSPFYVPGGVNHTNMNNKSDILTFGHGNGGAWRRYLIFGRVLSFLLFGGSL